MKLLVNNLIVTVFILFTVPPSAFAWCSHCEGDNCCVCSGKEHGLDEALCRGSFASCKEACDSKDTIWDPPLGPDMNYTDLHRAAEACDLVKERLAINEFPFKARNEEINRLDRDGHTPLANAARGGCIEIVKYLIKRGAIVDRSEGQGAWTPLLYAAEQHHAEVVEYLLAHGANVNVISGAGESPLLAAMRGPISQYGPKGNKDATIGILLKYGAKK